MSFPLLIRGGENLISRFENNDISEALALKVATFNGHLDVVTKLLVEGDSYRSGIACIAKKGFLNEVKELLANGDVPEHYGMAVKTAVEKGHFNALRVLLFVPLS